MVSETVVVSGGVSIFVNLVSISIQRYLRKSDKKRRKKKEWLNDVIAISRRLRRHGYSLDLDSDVDISTRGISSSGLSEVQECVDDLEEKVDNVPDELEGADAVTTARSFVSWYRGPDPTETDGMIDIQEKVIEAANKISKQGESEKGSL